MPLTLRSSSSRSLKAELGSVKAERGGDDAGGNGTLRFKTFSGSVRIDR